MAYARATMLGGSGSGGATAFVDLTDVPGSYSGQTLKIVRVNAGETGLEFATASGTGDVVGPASAVNNKVVFFDGTTGKLIKDSGLSLSGTNTGDQTITLTGDVTGSGTGSFATTIANSAVTNAKVASGISSLKVTTTVTSLTDAATIATDASLGNIFTVTLGGNRTLGAPTNPTNGQKATWRIKQDGTGSRTLAYDAVFRFGTDVASATLTTTANKTDYLGCIYNATDVKWDVVAFSRSY